jgi:hypothetical protein
LRAYVVHTLPLFAGLAALWICNWTRENSYARAAVVGGFLAVQALGIGYGFWANQYHNDFLGVVRYINQHGSTDSRILASGEFGFAYGFDGRVKDDVTLGFYTGKRPEFYVAGPYYQDWIKRAETRDPKVFSYVRRVLAQRYRPVYANPEYTIYQLQ